MTIDGLNIADVTDLSIIRALEWVKSDITVKTSDKEKFIAAPIVKNHFTSFVLDAVGLNYLTLSREAGTLAGGEAQRIRLASQIGTGLTGVLYVLDEPTIGLHQRDNHRLIETLKHLRDTGNSVIVVEHDRDTMLASDYIVDFGPRAGKHGGQVVAKGTPKEIMKNPKSITGGYLSKKKVVALRHDAPRKGLGEQLMILGAQAHNLKSLDIGIPLGTFTCIAGVSGSGKSTLLYDVLYLNLAERLQKW